MATSKGSSCRIGPSILNADLSNLAEECRRFMAAGADYLHLDVMDGNFVPNLTFGHPVVKCLRPKLPDVYFEMHMMVADPEKWIEPVAESGGNLYTFHFEATDDPGKCIRKIQEAGMQAGLGINPATPVECVLPYVDMADLILVMTVNPGFGGQKFMEECLSKIRTLRERYQHLDIEVDGGVGPATIQACADAGANVIVSGSAVVKSEDPRATMNMMRKRVEDSLQKAALER